MSEGARGTWLARRTLGGADARKSLEERAELAEGQRYDAAVKAATAWFAQVDGGAPSKAVTVAQVCRNYVDHLRQTKGDIPADFAAARHAMFVLDRPAFAAAEVMSLNAQDFRNWRKHVTEMPTASRSNRGNKRKASTLNRDMTVLRAALNLAHEERLVSNRHAWQGALEPIKGADSKREGYFDREQRTAFVAAVVKPDERAFFSALASLPFRPGVLAKLTVGQYEPRLSSLTLPRDKNHPERRIVLPPEMAKLFAAQCVGKTPLAPIFSRDSDGGHWHADTWKGPLKEAILIAGLPRTGVAYTLRHSTITDLLRAGVDVGAVAAMAGTSILMIQRHYAHLVGKTTVQALQVLAL